MQKLSILLCMFMLVSIIICRAQGSWSDTINFTPYPDGTVIITQYLNQGVLFSGYNGSTAPIVHDYDPPPPNYGRTLRSDNWFNPFQISFVDTTNMLLYRLAKRIEFDNVVEFNGETDYMSIDVYDSSDVLIHHYLSISPERVVFDFGTPSVAYITIDDSASTSFVVDNILVDFGDTITRPCPLIYLVYSITNASYGLKDGAVKVNVSGGQEPYSYSLDSIAFQASSSFTELDTGTYQVFVIDSNGCSGQGTFTITYDTTVSTQHINNLNSIKVFPNPFSDQLFIELEKETDINVKLIDVLGRVVCASKHENTSTIKLNVAQIPQGVYYLEILNNKGEKLHTTSVQIKAG